MHTLIDRRMKMNEENLVINYEEALHEILRRVEHYSRYKDMDADWYTLSDAIIDDINNILLDLEDL